MANKHNPKPTNDADSSNGENETDVTQAGKEAGGESNTPTKPSIEALSPELQAIINSKLAAARRDGEESGKNKAKLETEQQTEAERQEALKEQQQFQPLYEAEKAKAEKAESRAIAAEKSLLSLEVALEKKLPNPHLAAKRLIGETREELIEDAEALLKVLKSEDSPKPKGDEENPPATSEGGDLPAGQEPSDEIADDKYTAQRQSEYYNF